MEGQQPSPDELQTGDLGFSGTAELQAMNQQTQPAEVFSFSEDRKEVTDKRFALNNESFAKDRLGTVRSEVAALKQQYPEAVGFTLFGSMMRGRATEASDIDGYIFIDADIAQQRHPGDQILRDVNGETRLVPSMEDGYAASLRSALEVGHGFTPEQSKEIRVLPISRQIIDQEVDALVDEEQKFRQYVREHRDYWDSDMQGEAPKMPESFGPERVLYTLFHLEVGQGMAEYRNYLIQKLQGMGEIGEAVWRLIVDSTKYMERGHDTEEAFYPTTLEVAHRIYGS